MCARRGSPCTVPSDEGLIAPLPCQVLEAPLESIVPNVAMILPHGANPDRMRFSEKTGLDSPTFERFDEAKPGLPSHQ
jgi:hypothetical protein